MKTVKTLLMFTMVIMPAPSFASQQQEFKIKEGHLEVNNAINIIFEQCGSRDGFDTIKTLLVNESEVVWVTDNQMPLQKLFVPKEAFSVINKFALVFGGTSGPQSVREFGREFRKSKKSLSKKSAEIMKTKIQKYYTSSSD